MLASSWKVNNAQQYASVDAMMICTGSTFKWISATDFYELGKVIFIDAPADAPDNIHNLDCSFVYINDHDKQKTHDLINTVKNIAYRASVLTLAQRPYTAYPYQTAQTRASPLV
ncbi:hypothetical protein [Paraglaciecola algarum]|uniref:hypothetical protein n=1 Tax=Paraglaciecola algarum TaxID=3050085 RepID=UPI001F29A399|nr:hypothetical protein [Paraglaciecola sp. G1-23]